MGACYFNGNASSVTLLVFVFRYKLLVIWEFPGGPVVRTQCFHCLGPGVQSLVRELRYCKLYGTARKKKIYLSY